MFSFLTFLLRVILRVWQRCVQEDSRRFGASSSSCILHRGASIRPCRSPCRREGWGRLALLSCMQTRAFLGFEWGWISKGRSWMVRMMFEKTGRQVIM